MWKVPIVITFLLSYSAIVKPQVLRPITDNMCGGRMDGVIFPDPQNCDVFVQCQKGNVVMQRCDRGDLFDLNLYYCVSAEVVNCGQRRRPNIVSPPQQTNQPPSPETHHSVCRNVRNGELLANPTNCRAFIECQQNLRLDRECGPGELFEARSGVCLSDFTVDCGDRVIPSPVNDIVIRNICVGVPNHARVPDPRDCGRYFNCVNQRGVGQECDQGQLFETSLAMCIHERAVNCGGRGGSNGNNNQIISQDGAITIQACSNLPSGSRISDPHDCQKFYECRNNMRIENTCPPNQSFDIGMSQCRPSNSVTCGTRRNLRNPTLDNAICIGQVNGRRFGNLLNCRAFIECQANNRVDRECPNGELFDVNLSACLPAHNVRCNNRSLPPLGSEPMSPEDFFPPCPRTGVSYRSHPHDCSGYFICAEGHLIQHSCAPGIHFNAASLQCDFPSNANCRLSRIVIPHMPLLPDCNNGEDYFPNLLNCKQYFVCEDSTPKLKDCPSGSVWNNKKLQCDKTYADICASSFNIQFGTFDYRKPKENEIK
ncbi:CLUMA_CG002669, isoform A, partial [Clunio marinus]